MFDKLKDMYQAQKKMNELKKALEAVKIEHEVLNGKIKVEMDGTQRVLSVRLEEELCAADKRELLQRQLVVALNGATDKVQRAAQQHVQANMGDLKIPGLGG